LAVFEVLGAPALVRSAFTDPMEELRPGFEPEGGPLSNRAPGKRDPRNPKHQKFKLVDVLGDDEMMG